MQSLDFAGDGKIQIWSPAGDGGAFFVSGRLPGGATYRDRLLRDNFKAEAPSDRDYADALDDFLNALGIFDFDVVANSFGTTVAQRFAYYYPRRIRRAIFTGTSAARSTTTEDRAQTIRARAAMIASGGYGFGERYRTAPQSLAGGGSDAANPPSICNGRATLTRRV